MLPQALILSKLYNLLGITIGLYVTFKSHSFGSVIWIFAELTQFNWFRSMSMHIPNTVENRIKRKAKQHI